MAASRRLQGLGVSSGVALGPAHIIAPALHNARPYRGSDEEMRSLESAVAASVGELERLAQTLREDGLEAEAGIMDAQALMAADPSLLEAARDGIAVGMPAPEAVQAAATQLKTLFEGLDDPYIAGRAADVQDVADRLSGHLRGDQSAPIERPSVLVANDLTPSQTAAIDRSLVLGFATDTGSTASHSAILARALGLPAVVGVDGLSQLVQLGDEVGIDGETGLVVVNPDEEERDALRRKADTLKRSANRLRALRDLPAETKDGLRVTLAANIGSTMEVSAALEAGAEGIGLFRTEFLFAGRAEMPEEDEQVGAYSDVLSRMAPHTVIIRTLDVGGDKPLPYLPQPPEMNPFLGERGIRYALAHEEVLRTQLRALLRASPTGRLAIMLPMISTVEEIQTVRTILSEVQDQVGGTAELGIMVEIPAAALLAGALSRHVAFLSAGTNDLVQYTLAVDRTNSQVATLYRSLHPAILRLLQMAADGAHAAGRWIGVCGEMAGDLPALPLLVGLGIDELSMAPSRIPEVRARIRALDAGRCRELARRALECETAAEVEDLVRSAAE